MLRIYYFRVVNLNPWREGRIADVPLCILFPLSPFSSHRSHNCKREGNYNLLSMILQIDFPFPLLMNTLLFLVFQEYLDIYLICPSLLYNSPFTLCLAFRIVLIRMYSSILLWVFGSGYLSVHKMCSSLGIYQPKSFHCPPVNTGSALIVPIHTGTGVRQCWPLIGPWSPAEASDWSVPSSIIIRGVIMYTIRPRRVSPDIDPSYLRHQEMEDLWDLLTPCSGPLVPGIIWWYKSDSDTVAKIRLTIDTWP